VRLRINRRKYTYEEVLNIVEKLGYELISEEYESVLKKIHFKDHEGYYYTSNLSVLNQGKHPYKFHKSNLYVIKNIKLWLKLNNKSFELLSEEYENNYINLKWKCLKNTCNEVFEMNWNCVINGQNCSYCHGQQVGLSNCLAIKNPQLASEWHPTKNGDLTPYDVTWCSGKSVWWLCSKGHEWDIIIANRTNGNNCPYCSGRYASKEYNLLLVNPELCKEWDYNKNNKKPEEYTPNSISKVYWKCNKCGWEWKAKIHNRNNNRGCPQCNKSEGEKAIKKWLENNQIYYICQKEFSNLIGINKGKLSYDFYLSQYNLLVEYQGEQHDHPVDFKGKGMKYAEKEFKKQVEHDKRKKEYAKNNNIELLEIWYWDFDNIEKILDEIIKRKTGK